jgi:hypothetical protein
MAELTKRLEPYRFAPPAAGATTPQGAAPDRPGSPPAGPGKTIATPHPGRDGPAAAPVRPAPASAVPDDSVQTLFWHPQLATDPQGKTTIQFNIPVSVAAIRVTAEGCDGSGLGSAVMEQSVGGSGQQVAGSRQRATGSGPPTH